MEGESSLKTISVIVPVYNVEKYLDEAIQSLINQTIFESLSVILVNDGSTDSSAEIARKYTNEYPNIQLVEKENGGLSSARNYGLTFVNTKYVMFLDSDDMYTEDACEQLLNYAEECDLSITVGDLETFPTKTPKYKWKKHFGHGNKVIDLYEGGEDLLRLPSACNKLFKTELFEGNKEVFPKSKHFEDAFAIVPLLIKVRRIGIVDSQVYEYRQRDDGTSIMNSVFVKRKNYYDHFELNAYLNKLFVNNDFNAQIQYAVKKFMLETNHGFINNIFNNKTVKFDDKELTTLFSELTPIYQKFEWIELERFIKHRLLKNVYYALYSNDLNLFLNPLYYTSEIVIQENNIISKDRMIDPQINEVHLYLSLEYVNDEDDHLHFVGEILSNNSKLDKNLKNNLWITFKNQDNVEIEPIKLTKFNKLDSPFITKEKQEALGFEFKVNKKLLLQHKGKFVLEFFVEDYATGILRAVIGQAHGFFHKHKGNIANNIYMDINPTTRIVTLHTHMSFSDKYKMAKSKYFNKGKLKIGAKLRFLHKLTNWYLKKKNIVLIGERPDTFADNSAAFFKKLGKLPNKKKNYYYLLNRNSPHFNEAKKYGNVIAKNSLKHYLYLLSADTIVNSYDPDSYMCPSAYSKPDYYRIFGDLINYKRIFLQHGVTYNNVVTAISNYRTNFDGIVVTNEFEKEMFINKAYYKEEVLIESGFPRYERLREIKSNSEKRILLMPTWRKDLAPLSYVKKAKDYQVDASSFLSSEYYEFYKSLLTNKELHDILEKENIYLDFYPHYEMRVFLSYFEECETDRIKIVPDSKNVQDLLIECDMLITDYSSVFFDVLFMKKPVLFTQFDLEEFYTKHYKKGYLDFTKEELGQSVETISETIEALKGIINNNYQLDKETNTQVERYLQYAYSDNNKIILEFIESI